jgi:RNA methyltransferase, TrmH family
MKEFALLYRPEPVCYAENMRVRHGASHGARQPEILTSRDNQWLRRFRAALSGERARDEACVGIEGARLVEEALRSAIPIEAILTSESGRKYLSKIASGSQPSARILATSDKLFEQISDTKTPQGIAALVLPRAAGFDDLLPETGAALIIVMCGLQDPGNVGTILRAAEALGASGAVACAAGTLNTARIFSPKVMRASAGAVLRFPIVEGMAAPVLLAQFRMSGVKTFAAASTIFADDARKASAPWETNLREPVAIFIGNEGAGLPAEIERSTDGLLRIPLAAAQGANVESLNAATAASILLYEAARQRSAVTVEPGKQRESSAAHRINR